ncbi:MAG: hypothetical protein ABUL71_02070, partial [Gemmatimonadota bacterium]
MTRWKSAVTIVLAALVASCGGNPSPAPAPGANRAAPAPAGDEFIASRESPCALYRSDNAACLNRAPNPARRDSAGKAFAGGLMALNSVGIRRFATDHPTWDGRGVLIAVMDSGIDPAIPGLGVTSDGAAKILD